MNFNIISVVVIDDEDDIREILSKKLNESEKFEVVGQADSVSATIELLRKESPTLMFLDIRLIGGDAFDILYHLKEHEMNIPLIVMNTAYSEFEYAQRALNDFSDNIVKFLKKPFWDNWEVKKQEIVEKVYSQMYDYTVKDDFISVTTNNNIYRISIDDILFCEVAETGSGKTKMYTVESCHIINETLSTVYSILPLQFIQIFRSIIININYLKRYDRTDEVVYLKDINDRYFSVGKTYRKTLLKALK